MAPIILSLKALGIDNLAKFDFISPPQPKLLMQSLEVSENLNVENLMLKIEF